jgi:cell envelope-related function transcriptional attenuator common domain
MVARTEDRRGPRSDLPAARRLGGGELLLGPRRHQGRQRATAGGRREALNHQDSLILSTPTNILLLGTDHANQPGHEGQRSDSIMLIRTDPSRHRVAYLSIPRDLRVPIEGVGDTKINAAMQSGGAPLAIKTIRAYTGLPINHVITVDFSQFRDVIDALGGITVDVPERIVSKFDCPLKTNAECDRGRAGASRKGRNT